MAARRLVLAMVALLAIATLLASLSNLPDREGEGATTSGDTASVDPATAGPGSKAKPGRRLQQAIKVGSEKVFVIPIRVGDLLELEVYADPPGEVMLPALDRIEFADTLAPARFSILAEEPGRLPITLGKKQKVAEIRISADGAPQGARQRRAP